MQTFRKKIRENPLLGSLIILVLCFACNELVPNVGYCSGLLHSRLVLGQFSVQAFLALCVYFGIGLFCTCKLFGKQELDF